MTSLSLGAQEAARESASLYADDASRFQYDEDDSMNNAEGGLNAEESKPFRYCHPDSRKIQNKCPWILKLPIFGEACEAYGPKCTLSLGFCYLMCKGIADQILRGATYAMLRGRYGIDVKRYQRLQPISSMGWSLKAFTAALCDTFACFGYTKRWYMFISCVLGGVFAIIYGILPAKQSSADTACAFIFLSCFGKANVDVLSEGHYSRLIRKVPGPGPALISWIWWFIMIGAIVASVINGPLADQGKQQNGIFASGALQIVTGAIFLFNWYGEKTNREERAEDARVLHEDMLAERARLAAAPDHEEYDLHNMLPNITGDKDLHPENSFDNMLPDNVNALQDALRDDDGNEAWAMKAEEVHESDELVIPEPTPCLFGAFEINKEVITRNWRIFAYSGVMTCAVVAMTCGNILADTLGLLIIAVVVSVVCCGTGFWALPLVIAKANVFCYFVQAAYVNVSSAIDSFYLAKSNCNEGGPNFSYTFYNTVGSVIGNVAGLAGVAAFTYIFSQHSFRIVSIVTTIIQVIAAVFDIIIVKRWNLYIGIPDHAMYICGDAVVGQVCYMLGFMPTTILLSRLCPRGSESVVYALLAGFANLGQTTAAAIGAIIMEYKLPVYASPDERRCDFSHMPWLLFITHICCPLIIIPLTLLLPSARICDDLDEKGHVVVKDPTKYSLHLEDDNDDMESSRAEPLSNSDAEREPDHREEVE